MHPLLSVPRNTNKHLAYHHEPPAPIGFSLNSPMWRLSYHAPKRGGCSDLGLQALRARSEGSKRFQQPPRYNNVNLPCRPLRVLYLSVHFNPHKKKGNATPPLHARHWPCRRSTAMLEARPTEICLMCMTTSSTLMNVAACCSPRSTSHLSDGTMSALWSWPVQASSPMRMMYVGISPARCSENAR
jgi:hypothetical protein